ncbi:MAG: hypothetical protein WC627_01385 [Legionella sp.]|jgi:hypothetical protein
MRLNSFPSLNNKVLFSVISSIALTSFCSLTYSNAIGAPPAKTSCTGTVLDNFYLKPAASARATSSMVDLNGTLFVAGSAYTASNNDHWVVRKSTDGGLTWTTVDDYQLVAGANTTTDIEPAIGKDTNGNLYVAGIGFDASRVPHWIVRKSSNQGATWTTVDNFVTNGSVTIATGVTADANGNVYVSGYGSTKSTGYHWFVRKSSNQGTSWTTVDDFQFSSGVVAEPSAITADNNGVLYASGSANNRWVVRKSNDNGATWTTVDNYQGTGGLSVSRAIVADANNNIYSAGISNTSKQGESIWTVRKSTDAGVTWQTVDSYQLAAGKLSQASALNIDANGVIYVTGYGQNGNGYNWVTRMSTDNGATWSTIDVYQLKAKVLAMAQTVWTDVGGHVYIGGKASSRWIVRKLSC